MIQKVITRKFKDSYVTFYVNLEKKEAELFEVWS